MTPSAATLTTIASAYRDLVAQQNPAHTWTDANVRTAFTLLVEAFGLELEKFMLCTGDEVHYAMRNEIFPGWNERRIAFGEFCRGKLAWRTGAREYGYHSDLPLPPWGYISSQYTLHNFLLSLDGAQ